MTANVSNALEYLRPADLDYTEWVEVGMALKAEGCDVSVWDNWSCDDARYKPGECIRKWDSFSGSGVTGGTIIHMAQERGWTAQKDDGAIGWGGVIEEDRKPTDQNDMQKPTSQNDTQKARPAIDLSGLDIEIEDADDSNCRFDAVIADTEIHFYVDDAIQIIEKLFREDDLINYVTHASFDKDRNKWIPASKGTTRRAGDLLTDLQNHRDNPREALGRLNDAAGVWMRINSLDGNGVKNENVTSYRYALVECDDPEMPPREQEKLYRRLRLPIAAMIYSGGKSLHAWVKVDAPDREAYSKRVKSLYAVLKRFGFQVDEQNKNPARLSRMPGAVRGDQVQRLIDTDVGFASWAEWYQWFIGKVRKAQEGETVPEVPKSFSSKIRSLTADYFKNDMQPRKPELIEGVLRQGHKMLISGSSKIGKSFLLIQLGVSIAEGGRWLGFQCRRARVLYLNLEIDPASFENRVQAVYQALGYAPSGNFDVIHLRGQAKPLDQLANEIVADAEKLSYGAVIFDPIYKIMMGDENNASDMGRFVNQFDRICEALGASCIYCHHHAKGYSGAKRTIDRMSGSGVFARDPDAVLDVSELEATEFIKSSYCDEGIPLRVEFVLREFKSPDPVDIWFRYPCLYVDMTGQLKDLGLQGSPVGNLAKTGKMSTDAEQVEQIRMCFEAQAFEDDAAKNGLHIDRVVNMITERKLGQSEDRRMENGRRKVERWFKHNPDLAAEYTLKRGIIYPVNCQENDKRQPTNNRMSDCVLSEYSENDKRQPP